MKRSIEHFIAKKQYEDLTMSDVENWVRNRIRKAYRRGRINKPEKKFLFDCLEFEGYVELCSTRIGNKIW